MTRKQDYFGDVQQWYGYPKGVAVANIAYLYPQERDWTCGIACLRSLLNTINVEYSEDDLIKLGGFTPGPKSSKDFTRILKNVTSHIILSSNGMAPKCPGNFLFELLKDYNLMLETAMNGGHWVVILGLYNLGTSGEDRVVYYCPYFNEVRAEHLEEFISTWGVHQEGLIDYDYLAISKK